MIIHHESVPVSITGVKRVEITQPQPSKQRHNFMLNIASDRHIILKSWNYLLPQKIIHTHKHTHLLVNELLGVLICMSLKFKVK